MIQSLRKKIIQKSIILEENIIRQIENRFMDIAQSERLLAAAVRRHHKEFQLLFPLLCSVERITENWLLPHEIVKVIVTYCENDISVFSESAKVGILGIRTKDLRKYSNHHPLLSCIMQPLPISKKARTS